MRFVEFLVLCNFLVYISASIIPNDNQLTRTGRINSDGLTSTLIKTHQQLNLESNRGVNGFNKATFFDDNDNQIKNDDTSHIRLYYKSNSPDRSVSHEVEHRYMKNPNLNFNQNLIPQEPNTNMYSVLNNPFQQVLNNQNNPIDKNKLTLFNLHYHGNSFDPTTNTYRTQKQDYPNPNILEQQQRQQALKNSLLRILMLHNQNNQYNQARQPQFSFPQYQSESQNNNMYKNNNNGLQYKIVHLKFKLEPQFGRFVGQGYIETDNGAGSVVNSRYFNFLPRELPELIKRLILSAQQQPNFDQSNNNYNRVSVAHILKKRQTETTSDEDGYVKLIDRFKQFKDSSFSKTADDSSNNDAENINTESNVEKRNEEYLENDSNNVDKVQDEEEVKLAKKNEYNDEESKYSQEKNEISNEVEKREDLEEKSNDSEFQESFQNLQRRDETENETELLTENRDDDYSNNKQLRNDTYEDDESTSEIEDSSDDE